jgi:hypothetical protein
MSLVSVLMPMRNAEPFVCAAVESVLAQEGVDLEVVVIDDGSTDRSAAVVQGIGDPRVRVLPGPRAGISAALNAALEAARGEVVTRCDADDLYPRGRLAKQLRWLEKHPEFGALCGRFTTMTSKGKLVAELDSGSFVEEEITYELRRGRVRTSLCTFAIRTPLLRQIGGCRPYFVTAEDYDLQLRLGEVTRVWFVPRSVYWYRLHDASITHVQGRARQAFFEEVAREFQEQRLAGRPDDLERGCPPTPPELVADTRVPVKEEVEGLLLGQAWEEHAEGHRLRAFLTGLSACSAHPGSLAAWKNLAALALKRTASNPKPAGQNPNPEQGDAGQGPPPAARGNPKP